MNFNINYSSRYELSRKVLQILLYSTEAAALTDSQLSYLSGVLSLSKEHFKYPNSRPARKRLSAIFESAPSSRESTMSTKAKEMINLKIFVLDEDGFHMPSQTLTQIYSIINDIYHSSKQVQLSFIYNPDGAVLHQDSGGTGSTSSRS